MSFMLNTQAEKDGIVIRGQKRPEYGIKTKYNNSGEICYEISIFDEAKDPLIALDYRIYPKKFYIIVAILDIIFLAFAIIDNVYVGETFLFCVMSLDFFSFIKFYYEFVINGKNMPRYYSAKVMLERAYKKYHRVPTLEEIKKVSRFSQYGTHTLNNLITGLSCLLTLRSVLKTNYILLCFFVILIIVLKVISKKDCNKYLQAVFLPRPTEKELQLAIEALKLYEKWEKIDDH